MEPAACAGGESWADLLGDGVGSVEAVAGVEEASTVFRGADLQLVDLDGVVLEDIRWDSPTGWPPGWEKQIWRASLAAGTKRGELIVGVEHSDSTVPADI
ncbi:hypothetical protein [Streptomyces sp. b84]|uniref:hypothetical protein n=1 Tax=Streptomyces sp. b84 TaxID=1827631 RepID=UPI00117CA25D|nr:hypothetical protein [Streptomyces sp. b84]